VYRLRNIAQWLKPYWGRLAFSLFFVVLQAVIALALPLLFGKGIIDYVLLEAREPRLLALVATGAVVLMVFKGLVVYAQTYSTELRRPAGDYRPQGAGLRPLAQAAPGLLRPPAQR